MLRSLVGSEMCIRDRSKGMVERRQNMIISFLRKNTNTVADQNSWDDKLPTLITILNSTTSASRKQSPFFLTFLQHPRFPYSSALADRPNYKEDSLIAHKLNMQQRVIKQVEKFFHSAFLESKTQFDKKVAIREFPLGCKVFVFSTQRGLVSKKLHKPYKGPYICVGPVSYTHLTLPTIYSV